MLLAASEFWRRPTQWRAVAFGAALALVALTRAEAALLFGILAVPMVIMAPGLDWRRRLERLGGLALAAVVLIGPWVGFNIVRFEEPAYLSTGSGVTLVDTSCDPGYSGDFVGWWSFKCVPDRFARDADVKDLRNSAVAASC